MKVDLHLHSRYSGEAAQWLYRKIGLPASCAEPVSLYAKAKELGMQFFTLTDLDTLQGCLSIADKTDVFLSVELTTQFPEDRAPVHLLVWGISEAQFAELQKVRDNIYEVQRYLATQELTHAVAHPLQRMDERFGTAHLEKLVLLFRHFESLCGASDALICDVTRFILESLTPEKITEFASRHDIAPTHSEPWKKVMLGGSNDLSGLFIANAYTETEPVSNIPEFLAAIRVGKCRTGGQHGTPLTHAHGTYSSLFNFTARKVGGLGDNGLIGKVFSRFLEGEIPTEFSFSEKLSFLGHSVLTGKIWELAKPANASAWRQFSATFQDSELKASIAHATEGVTQAERRAFITACLFADRLLYQFFTKFVHKLSSGSMIEAIQNAGMLAPIALGLTPYFLAFRQTAPDRKWLRDTCDSFAGECAPVLQNNKRAWFTDTLEDINGVATTIRKMTAATVANGDEIVVITSRGNSELTGIPLQNFKPIGEFELPEYELQKLSFPPLLKILEYIQRERFTELIISTPGPIGLTALLAAKLLGIRTSGIYHTDFPQYVRILTDDRWWESLTWTFMRWFYSQMDTVWVNSDSCRHTLANHGIAPERLHLLPRGLDLELFNPQRRSPSFWESKGATAGAKVLLYVGRISKEKNLDLTLAAWSAVRRPGLALAFVGDGPYVAELKRRAPDIIFTGTLLGEELATAFASADLFLFPSATDTFGNVILEALASGVPCIVSDQGGPKNLITPGVNGEITTANNTKNFTNTVAKIIDDSSLQKSMSKAAVESVKNRNWSKAARAFWDATI